MGDAGVPVVGVLPSQTFKPPTSALHESNCVVFVLLWKRSRTVTHPGNDGMFQRFPATYGTLFSANFVS